MAWTDATEDWQSVNLTRDESWQVRAGVCLFHSQNGVTPGTNDDEEFGAEVRTGDSHFFASGQTVWFRKGMSVTSRCAFNRNELAP